MAGNIKGITIEIGGNTGPLGKALDDVNKKSRDIQSELKQVERLLKLDPDNTVLVAQKQQLLSEAIENTKQKLEALKTAEKQVQDQFKEGKISEDQYRALQREVINTEQNLKGLESQAIKANAVLTKDEAIGNLKKIGVAAGAAAAAVGAAFIGMAKATVDNADELQRQADVTGLSAERLQELQYVGKNLGVELDTITGAQAKLTKSMAAAEKGTGTQAEAFKTLGISVLDGNGQLRDAKDVMNEAFTALNGVGNETERDALSMQIFGKSAMEMNPMIKAGGEELNKLSKEARDSGSVMSNEAVAGLDTFGDTIDNLKSSILGAFGEKFSEILPKIQEFLEKLKELPQWIGENSTLLEIIGVVIATVTALVIAFNIQQALLASGMTLWATIAGVATTVTTALGTAFTFLTSPIGLVILAIGAVIAAGILLYKHWDEVKVFAINTWTSIKDFFINTWNSIKEFFSNILDSIKKIAGDKFGFIFDSIIKIFNSFKLLFQGDFKGFITGIWDAAVEWAKGWLDIGKNIVTGIWEGIQSMASWLWDKVSGFFSSIVDGVKNKLGIHSPSTVFADLIGKNMALGIGVGFESEMEKVSKQINKSVTVDIPGNDDNPDTASSSGGRGFTQTVNIYSPTPLTPSEVARQTRNANRQLALGVKK